MESLRGLFSALYFSSPVNDFPKLKKGNKIMYTDTLVLNIRINSKELKNSYIY
jgi:hypothetical protein